MRFSKAATRTGPTCRGTISFSHGMSEHASIDPPSGAETANPERIRVEGWKVENLFGGLSPATPESTRSLRSQRCDFMDLVQSGNYSVVTLPAQPGDYSVTAFPAQNGFYTRPVAHQRHDPAGLGPRTGLV